MGERVTIGREDVGVVRVVAAAMTAVAPMGAFKDIGLAQALEDAMSQAVLDALAEGISINDTATILARKMAAREAVLKAVRG